MDLALRDRVAIVTGSARGIGLGIAQSLAAEGCRVVVTGQSEKSVAAAAASLRTARVETFVGDLTKEDVLAELVRHTLGKWGKVDILVANIGSGRATLGWALDDRNWLPVLDVNLHASRRAAEAVLPQMTNAGSGSIVFIASIAGIESIDAPLPYLTAKTALLAYAKGLARSVARNGIRVNVVAPGNILFEGGTWAAKMAAQPEAVSEYIDSQVPMARFGSPDEVGAAVSFLSSDKASFVTGSCLVVDGGQTRSV